MPLLQGEGKGASPTEVEARMPLLQGRGKGSRQGCLSYRVEARMPLLQGRGKDASPNEI
jgi:hypothetical protein